MDAHTRFQTQIVGALPVITHYFERLDLAATIDELVPWQGDVPLGTLVEVLVANRLLDPKPLYKLGSWATRSTHSSWRGPPYWYRPLSKVFLTTTPLLSPTVTGSSVRSVFAGRASSSVGT